MPPRVLPDSTFLTVIYKGTESIRCFPIILLIKNERQPGFSTFN